MSEPTIAPETLDKIQSLLISGLARAAVAEACRERLGLADEAVEPAIAAARRRIQLAADYDRDEEIGRTLGRCEDLYRRALAVQDTKSALAAERQRAKVLGIDRPGFLPEDRAAGPSGQPGAAPDAAGAETRRAEPELADLLDAIDLHIEPLGLAESLADTYTDLIRLAAERILDLQSRLARPKKPQPAPGEKNS